MKVIGLIGGMSWNSSLEYYRLINQLIAEKMGGLHSANVILYSLNFDVIERYQHHGQWDEVLDLLIQAGNGLKNAGADFIVLCTNTMHKVADRLEEEVGLPLLHIVDATGEAVRMCGLHNIGLLGTRVTMEEDFYISRLQELYNIEVQIPTADEVATIHRIIYDELCQGIIEFASRRSCLEIIDGMITQGVQGIILGCTELPLLIKQDDVDITLFDTTRIHAEAAVKAALEQ
jgi:aspartate racemase